MSTKFPVPSPFNERGLDQSLPFVGEVTPRGSTLRGRLRELAPVACAGAAAGVAVTLIVETEQQRRRKLEEERKALEALSSLQKKCAKVSDDQPLTLPQGERLSDQWCPSSQEARPQPYACGWSAPTPPTADEPGQVRREKEGEGQRRESAERALAVGGDRRSSSSASACRAGGRGEAQMVRPTELCSPVSFQRACYQSPSPRDLCSTSLSGSSTSFSRTSSLALWLRRRRSRRSTLLIVSRCAQGSMGRPVLEDPYPPAHLTRPSSSSAGPVPALAAVSARRAQESDKSTRSAQQRESSLCWRRVRICDLSVAEWSIPVPVPPNRLLKFPRASLALQVQRGRVRDFRRALHAHVPGTVQARNEIPHIPSLVRGVARPRGTLSRVASQDVLLTVLHFSQAQQEVHGHPSRHGGRGCRPRHSRNRGGVEQRDGELLHGHRGGPDRHGKAATAGASIALQAFTWH